MGKCKKKTLCTFFGSQTETCDYILITGHSRGCPPERCDKFKPGSRQLPKNCNNPVYEVPEGGW